MVALSSPQRDVAQSDPSAQRSVALTDRLAGSL
jgi:hypothetical protein